MAPKPDSSAAELQRQPSQQDLEIARQLQHFHTQSAVQKDYEDVRHTTGAVAQEQYSASNADDHTSLPPTQQPTSPVPSNHSGQRLPSPNPAMAGQVCTNCGTTKTPLWRRSPAGAVICNACGLYYKARNQMRPVGLKRSAAAMTPGTVTQTPTQSHDRSTSPAPLQSGANYISTDQIADGTCPGGGRCNSQGGQLICQGCPSFNNRIAKAAQVALRQANDRSTPTNEANADIPPANSAQQTVVVACQNCGTTVTPLWRRDEAGNAICNACGLYHKLHGHHRPVQMKKAEIKRRKRVVPANMSFDSATPEQSIDRSMLHVSQSSTSVQNQPMTLLEPRTGPSPIPVDFTDAFRSSAPQHSHHGEPQGVPSKRTYSSTTDSEPYSHAQNMGFSAINAIDPALPTRDDATVSKEARRAELRREAEKMRQMLKEKEREIAALADDA